MTNDPGDRFTGARRGWPSPSRLVTALIGVACGLLLLPTVALAGQIRVDGAKLVYVGGGEANDVLIQLEVTGDYIVGDTAGAMTMDAAATEVCQMHPDLNRAWCAGEFTALDLQGGLGNDKLTVHEGITIPATLDGWSGDDVLTGGGAADTLLGGPGPFANCSESTNDRDDLRGRGGVDTATYAGRSPTFYNVSISLNNLGDDGSTYTSPSTCSFLGGSYRPSAFEQDDVGSDVENVIGTHGADTLVGSSAANVLSGTGGNDILHGGDANDTLNGGPQNDELYGGLHDDHLLGETGNDSLNGGAGLDDYEGGDGTDALASRDSVVETALACGVGTDTLQRDPGDSISAGDCESFSPRAQGVPTLSGAPTEGQALTATAAWEAAPTPTEAYQWWRCEEAGEACTAIVGATSRSYLLGNDDVGKRLYARVTATNSLGDDVADSEKTATIADGAPANSAVPSISGTPRKGSTLTATTGAWSSPYPVTYAYQWERCPAGGSCASVVGATSPTYPLTSLDVGHALRVAVTATNSLGSSSAFSAQTAPVANVVPTIAIDDVTLPEGSSGGFTNAVLTVTLSEPNDVQVTVPWGTQNGNPADGAVATSPSDFTALSGTVTFAPGDVSETVAVPVRGDTNYEEDERFRVRLGQTGPPVNATIADPEGLATIDDDDAPPSVSVDLDPVVDPEGNAGTKNATFRVRLSAAAGRPISVAVRTVAGTAATPADFVGLEQTLTFAAGEQSKLVDVAVNGDTLDEAEHETFSLEVVSGPGTPPVTRASAPATIVDDDLPPTPAITSASLTEGDSGTKNATLQVSLSAPSGREVRLAYETQPGSAVAGGDYLPASGLLVFAPGTTTSPISVAVVGNTVWEGDETFEVRLAGVDQTVTMPTPAPVGSITILNDDPEPDTTAPSTTLLPGPSALTSARTASFTFSSSEPGSFRCSLDGAAAAPCASPKTYDGLVDGEHLFVVYAVDAAGNQDASPEEFGWTVDGTSPSTTLLPGPSALTSARTASFTFSSSEPGSFRCSLDGAAAESCTSPKAYEGLVDGEHTFVVFAVDAAGNQDSSPEQYKWTVDGTAPDTAITSPPPATTTDRNATIGFSSEAGAAFECSLDGAAFADCASPVSLSGLTVGPHSFRVRARDVVGNIDSTPAQADWNVTNVVTPPPPPVVQCKVPALKGKTLAAAKRALKKANCATGKVTKAFSTRAKKGKVLGQSLRAGTVRPTGAKVALRIGKGPRR